MSEDTINKHKHPWNFQAYDSQKGFKTRYRIQDADGQLVANDIPDRWVAAALTLSPDTYALLDDVLNYFGDNDLYSKSELMVNVRRHCEAVREALYFPDDTERSREEIYGEANTPAKKPYTTPKIEPMYFLEDTERSNGVPSRKEDGMLLADTADTQEKFASGAVRNKVEYRYDLMSPEALTWILPDPMLHLAELLLRINSDGDKGLELISDLTLKTALSNVLANGKSSVHLLTLYAEALHEGASKYGERNWEKGIPIPNLVNHALAHLCKLTEGDTSENHASHLVWNVMTIIHFRQAEQKK